MAQVKLIAGQPEFVLEHLGALKCLSSVKPNLGNALHQYGIAGLHNLRFNHAQQLAKTAIHLGDLDRELPQLLPPTHLASSERSRYF
jgi:hypothetical protein